jgi:hypothetical protein
MSTLRTKFPCQAMACGCYTTAEMIIRCPLAERTVPVR